jgi:hypothetical protein
MNSLKYIVLALAIGLSQLSFAQSDKLTKLKEEVSRLDKKTKEKWEPFEQWQKDSAWISETTQMALPGVVYSKGWLGPNVSRQIIPDFEKGWMVVDTVTVGTDLLLTLGNLATNVLFQYYFPYVQVGVIKDKSFVNVRTASSYEEALLIPRFDFKRMPFALDQIEKLTQDESFSTIATGGFYTRLGGGLMNMIGLELPAHLNFGPKVKFQIQESLKVTIAKDDETHVLVGLERARGIVSGLGIGFGLYFEDIIDVPVAVGIGSSNGYSPITFNLKQSHQKTMAMIYRIDINSKEGAKAYEAFLENDLTLLDELAQSDSSAVELEMVKEGDINTRESNLALNFIFWRSGWRNIFTEGHYKTTAKDGRHFEYVELAEEKISDKSSGGNYKRLSTKYRTLVPLDGQNSMVLDSLFLYSDSKTMGDELDSLSSTLSLAANELRLPIKTDPKRNYGAVHVDVRVRFGAPAMRLIFEANNDDTWIAVGTALGLPDPFIWETQSRRTRFAISHRGDEFQTAEERLYRKGERVVGWLQSIRTIKDSPKKARELIKRLKDGDNGRLLHKTLVELAGSQHLLIQGGISGRELY